MRKKGRLGKNMNAKLNVEEGFYNVLEERNDNNLHIALHGEWKVFKHSLTLWANAMFNVPNVKRFISQARRM